MDVSLPHGGHVTARVYQQWNKTHKCSTLGTTPERERQGISALVDVSTATRRRRARPRSRHAGSHWPGGAWHDKVIAPAVRQTANDKAMDSPTLLLFEGIRIHMSPAPTFTV